jgi:uncharacterized Zn finger protein
MSYYEWYPPSQPISTEQGLKARSKRGDFAKNWWATRWIEALETLMDAGRLRRGRRYARQGQVLSIEERTGGVVAKVQGSRSRPYRVNIELESFGDEQWEQVFEALAGRAIFAAGLLAGEMPEDIEEAFRAADASLFPSRRGELRTSCSCPDWAEVCKHTAAVHYILGEQFDEDPFLLFRLRGRTAEQVTSALRARRGAETEQEEVVDEVDLNAPPLEEEIERFWQAGPALDAVNVSIKPPTVLLAVLRRLGQPGFVSEDLEPLLAPAYEAVSQKALEAALGEPQETPEEEA